MIQTHVVLLIQHVVIDGNTNYLKEFFRSDLLSLKLVCHRRVVLVFISFLAVI